MTDFPLSPDQLLSDRVYYQLVHTLRSELPPPLDDTEAARIARDQAAIAEAASMCPVTEDEARMAAKCVLARARADEALQAMNTAAGNLALLMQLGRHYALMERTGNGLRAMLLRVQARRQKREANPKTATADEWVAHISLRRMQMAAEMSAPPAGATTPVAAPEPADLRMVEEEPPARAAAQDELPRDLAAEAKEYAAIHPQRARLIRRYGGLPPMADFPPPDDALLQAIVNGDDPTWYELDYSTAAD